MDITSWWSTPHKDMDILMTVLNDLTYIICHGWDTKWEDRFKLCPTRTLVSVGPITIYMYNLFLDFKISSFYNVCINWYIATALLSEKVIVIQLF